MKRLFKVVSASLIALIVTLFLASCDAKQQFKQDILKEDSLMITRMVESIGNPTFTNVDDAMAYIHGERQYRTEDSIFFSIPQKVIPDIISVLQKNHESVTKANISNEFANNKRIYLSLPDKPDVRQMVEMPNIPNTRVVDTIIDGKKYRLLESETSNSTITITRKTED